MLTHIAVSVLWVRHGDLAILRDSRKRDDENVVNFDRIFVVFKQLCRLDDGAAYGALLAWGVAGGGAVRRVEPGRPLFRAPLRFLVCAVSAREGLVRGWTSTLERFAEYLAKI